MIRGITCGGKYGFHACRCTTILQATIFHIVSVNFQPSLSSIVFQTVYWVARWGGEAADQGLLGWISEREDNLQNHEFRHPASYWTGERTVKELQRAGIDPMYFLVLQECATKEVKAASDTYQMGHTCGRAMTPEGLFSSLSYFFANNGRNSCDYQLALQRLHNLNMRRSFQSAILPFKPDVDLFLGDHYGAGPYMSDEHNYLGVY